MNTELRAVVDDASALRGRALRAVMAGASVAGTLDILYAFSIWGLRDVSPLLICQSIAAGLLGRGAAFSGGIPTALLGLLLHYAMALVMAAIYYWAASNVPFLVNRAALCGIVYGLAIYGAMNYIVIPLSALGAAGAGGPPIVVITGVLVHMFLVGLPIALFARRALQRH